MRTLLASVAACLLAAFPARSAVACGCFVPPVSQPVIQAGERILFTVKNGEVTAFIQIQYSGLADQFGWLLPLPSLPKLEVGTDEMFVALHEASDPEFTLNVNPSCVRTDSAGGGCGGQASRLRGAAGEVPSSTRDPALVVDSVGPYDYAVLDGSDRKAMLDWLSLNRFYVPAGTDQAVVPYVHPGAYFLALKLRSGKATGDVQPVVVRYRSDLPMIPIVLTSVGAVPHMGILVWVLGAARAIPRNYHHTVLDFAALDWRGAANYNDLLVRAVGEAPRHHTFVTEYAGTSAILDDLIPVPSTDPQVLEKLTDVLAFLSYLTNTGFSVPFTSTLKAIFAARIEQPKELIQEGLLPSAFYGQPLQFLREWKQRYPNAAPLLFDAKATSDEIAERVLNPLMVAAAVFKDDPYLTRFHTALSPEEMTEDPVFSFNPDLPPVSNRHTATLAVDCDGNGQLTIDDAEQPTTAWPDGSRPVSADALPASLRIEAVSEAGPPTVVTDNRMRIHDAAGARAASIGCAVRHPPASRGMLLILGLLATVSVTLRRRRRGANS